jgi:glutathione S-transferase
MRARLALAVSGTCCELREVKLGAKPLSMLEASPKGTVPVLILPNGGMIDESLEIMRWALAQSDPEAWLARDDAALIAMNDGPFKHDLDRYKYPERHDSDAIEHRDRSLAFLRKLDQRISAGGQLCGSDPGLADVAIMPFVRQFAAVDRAWFEAQPLPHLQTWLDGHIASDLFAAIMVRVTPWSPGDPPLLFPAREGGSARYD